MNTIAAFFVGSGIVSALVIASDLPRRKQSMKIMNSVWILTGLWGGFFALWAYFRFGRAKRSAPVAVPMRMEAPDAGSMPMGNKAETRMPMDMGRDRPKWQSVVLSTLHCGAGCTLADLIGESFLYFVPVAIGVQAQVVTARAEEYVRTCRESYDIVTSRAVARLNVLAELCLPYAKVGGVFLAMKGALADEEIDEARRGIAQLGGSIERVYEYPIQDAVHKAVVIRKQKPTPPKYPRAFAKIKKSPL